MLILRCSAVAIAAVMITAGTSTQISAEPAALQVLGEARVNNRTEIITFRISPPRRPISAICVRSGSLPLTLVAIEIEFSDGTQQRVLTHEILAAGYQSARVPLDGQRTLDRIVVSKKPGLRAGETTVQLLGTVENGPR